MSTSVSVGEWHRRGACSARDAARFFQPIGDPRRARRQREARAVAVCAACPVRAECAAHALTARERCGVWGGFTESDRRQLWTLGWLDVADPRRRRVDVRVLDRRLAIRAGRHQNLAAGRTNASIDST